jgi:hypothetical protein
LVNTLADHLRGRKAVRDYLIKAEDEEGVPGAVIRDRGECAPYHRMMSERMRWQEQGVSFNKREWMI